MVIELRNKHLKCLSVCYKGSVQLRNRQLEGMHRARDGASMPSPGTSPSLDVFTILDALQILLFKSVYRV